MKALDFYDVKLGKKFRLTKYKLVKKKTKAGMRTFAVGKSPVSKIAMWRIVASDFKG